MTVSAEQIQRLLQEEFRGVRDRLDALHARVVLIEQWWEREQGFREGSGSLPEDIRRIKVRLEKLEGDVRRSQVQQASVTSGATWLIGMVGGSVGFLSILWQLFRGLHGG